MMIGAKGIFLHKAQLRLKNIINARCLLLTPHWSPGKCVHIYGLFWNLAIWPKVLNIENLRGETVGQGR